MARPSTSPARVQIRLDRPLRVFKSWHGAVNEMLSAARRSRSRSRSRYSRLRSAYANRGRAPSIPRSLRAGSARARKSVSLSRHSYSRWTEPATKDFVSPGLNMDFSFKFNDLISYSEFQTLYDQFRIDYVIVNIQLINNVTSLQPPGTTTTQANGQEANMYPRLWYVRDYDFGSSETLSSIKERQGVKCVVLQPNRPLRIKVVPKVPVQTYRTSTTTGYGPKRMFLDFANGVDVPHYGLFTVFDTYGINVSDTFPYKVRHEVKYYFTCKDVR